MLARFKNSNIAINELVRGRVLVINMVLDNCSNNGCDFSFQAWRRNGSHNSYPVVIDTDNNYSATTDINYPVRFPIFQFSVSKVNDLLNQTPPSGAGTLLFYVVEAMSEGNNFINVSLVPEFDGFARGTPVAADNPSPPDPPQ